MTTRDQVCLPCNMTVRDRPGKPKPEADPGWAETGRFKTPPPRKCLGSGKGNKIRRSLRCLNAIAHKAESRPAMFALFATAERPPLNSSGHIQQGLAPLLSDHREIPLFPRRRSLSSLPQRGAIHWGSGRGERLMVKAFLYRLPCKGSGRPLDCRATIDIGQ